MGIAIQGGSTLALGRYLLIAFNFQLGSMHVIYRPKT